MGMMMSAGHLKGYKQIALLLWKYGRSDLVQQLGFGDAIDPQEAKPPGPGDATPEQLADDLEAMGPTYVKLGQILSSRADLLPEPYLRALARLQDRCKPFPFPQVDEIVTAELGVRMSKAFSAFDPEPLAAASLGQVHLAALRDGRPVVVKVQRPDIARQIAEDFEILSQIAEFLDAHTEFGRRYRFLTVLEEFRIAIQQELDYEREATNLVTVGANLAGFEFIQIPQPILDYSTRRVLTMEYVSGRKITKLGPLARLENDGTALAEELFKAYLKQVLVDGLFHADPHPGNVFLTEDGRIALLDLGLVGHTSHAMQAHLIELLLAISERRSEEAAKVVVHVSQKAEEFDHPAFLRRIGQIMALQQGQGQQKMNFGLSLMEMCKAGADTGLYVPGELTLLGKTLLQLDEVGKILDPAFEPDASIRRNVGEIMTVRVRKGASQGNILHSLLDMKDFVTSLPARLNSIMDVVTNAKLEIKVKTLDAPLVMEGLEKIANRITAGVILAALIVGAALLMRVDTPFQLFGYPGLAILCFLSAAAGGFWLVISIFVHDQKSSKKPRR